VYAAEESSTAIVCPSQRRPTSRSSRRRGRGSDLGATFVGRYRPAVIALSTPASGAAERYRWPASEHSYINGSFSLLGSKCTHVEQARSIVADVALAGVACPEFRLARKPGSLLRFS
jgi:hypothetical protein